jgi:hypothetical protein
MEYFVITLQKEDILSATLFAVYLLVISLLFTLFTFFQLSAIHKLISIIKNEEQNLTLYLKNSSSYRFVLTRFFTQIHHFLANPAYSPQPITSVFY